ncbi:unnamed protein product [Orchesella dallaii]|uniref:Uncharacterized protein n=1 Tax=Orchesella dallaii TaxID=48710 RepID=A0ABP1PJ36_9HEXA
MVEMRGIEPRAFRKPVSFEQVGNDLGIHPPKCTLNYICGLRELYKESVKAQQEKSANEEEIPNNQKTNNFLTNSLSLWFRTNDRENPYYKEVLLSEINKEHSESRDHSLVLVKQAQAKFGAHPKYVACEFSECLNQLQASNYDETEEESESGELRNETETETNQYTEVASESKTEQDIIQKRIWNKVTLQQQ